MLAVVLIGGFAWYERSKPPSQIVALVAALAALAVAGRVAFPVIPNVVATTDIVIFTGYAIGPAPGFAVGALAGLVSNFWLGQGPWTPWQMAGWGLCGLFGAWLAAVTGRRLLDMGRLPLALACALAGFAYGALLDFSLMVTYGGEQSLDRFLALSSRGVPFNIAHAAGNFVIALVAGPAMIRMLIRFRERFEFRWRAQPALPLVALALLIGGMVSAQAEQASAKPSGKASGKRGALAWLRAAQNEDGGFGTDKGETSNPGMTSWVALGMEAAGLNPLDSGAAGKPSPIDYLRRKAKAIRTTADLERTILVLRGAGLPTKRFGGRPMAARLLSQRGGDGSFSGQVNLTAFGILALDAAGAPGNEASAAWLAGSQNPDGGWGFAQRTASDADSTGAALQALAAAGGHGDALSRGVGFLRGNQRPGGGFPLSHGAVNAQSTAWAVQGLVAAGTDPNAMQNGDPLAYLAARQAPDGHYRYSESSDQTPVWVTAQALAAVAEQPFPVDPVAKKKKSVH